MSPRRYLVELTRLADGEPDAGAIYVEGLEEAKALLLAQLDFKNAMTEQAQAEAEAIGAAGGSVVVDGARYSITLVEAEAGQPQDFSFTVTVSCQSQEQAERVLSERLGYDEDYGFDYTIEWAPAEANTGPDPRSEQ